MNGITKYKIIPWCVMVRIHSYLHPLSFSLHYFLRKSIFNTASGNLNLSAQEYSMIYIFLYLFFYLPWERIFKTIFIAFSDNVYSRIYNKYCINSWMISFFLLLILTIYLDYDQLLRSIKLHFLTYFQLRMKGMAIPSIRHTDRR